MFLKGVAGAASIIALPAALPARAVAQRRPNLLYIMADDLGYGDLSITGRAEYQTPMLDQFARDGVTLAHAYSSSAVCTPTRVALMTGRYPPRYTAGLFEPLPVNATAGLAPTPRTLPRLLNDVGYDTSLVGKWHLGSEPAFHPLRHGFDEFYGFLIGGSDYTGHNMTPRQYFYDGEQLVRPRGYLTDVFTDRAIAFVKRERTAPFFLSLQYNAPHWPWQAPGDPQLPDSVLPQSGGSPETFARMMQSLDRGVGRVLAALRERNLERDTFVVFTSDNGGERYSHMGPFRGRKGLLYEGGIRVAAFARWPGVIPAASSTDQVALTMDWTATMLALAGASVDTAAPLDGIDLMPMLTGRITRTSRNVYWRMSQRRPQKAMRSGDWKYLQTDEGEFLFDLATDRSEEQDRRTSEPVVFTRLKTAYAAWERTVLPPRTPSGTGGA
jgi:arylsulfatase A-like enzyme